MYNLYVYISIYIYIYHCPFWEWVESRNQNGLPPTKRAKLHGTPESVLGEIRALLVRVIWEWFKTTGPEVLHPLAIKHT